MKLAIGADHGGVELKDEVVKFLKTVKDLYITDVGTMGRDSVDYPDFGKKVAEAVSNGTVDRGILIDLKETAAAKNTLVALMPRFTSLDGKLSGIIPLENSVHLEV